MSPWYRAFIAVDLLLLCLLALSPQSARSDPPAGVELGQTIEGAGSANFAWLRMPGMQYGVAFRSPKSGKLTEVTLQWKTGGNYGGGTRGCFTFSLRANGEGNFPSTTELARAEKLMPLQAMDGQADGAFRVPLAADLQAGTIYHLVIVNVDPNVTANWSSPNTLMTRVQPWDGAGCRSAFNDGTTWRPWSSVNNPFNVKKLNEVSGAHCPLMLRWADGTVIGDPYYSAAVNTGAYFFGVNRAGEYITWNGPAATISRVGISVWKNGTPGPLRYHLEQVGGAELATGILDTSAVGEIAGWAYAALPQSVMLQQDQCYRLWFDSPASPDRANCYFQAVPYGENRPPEWLTGGWGGTASYYVAGDGATWTERINADLTFSLL